MIISHKYKFIFIHLQKNAGTSIVKSLVPHIGSDCEIYGSTPDGHILSDYNKPKGKLWKHIWACNAKKLIDTDIWNEYFKFAFIRNPWSRILSQYSWWTQRKWDDEKNTGARVKNMKNFGEYLIQKIGIVPNQKIQLFDEDVSLVDYIGRFEYIEEDFKEVCKLLKFKNVDLLFENKTNHRDYRTYYDKKSIEIVEEIYNKDIESFGFNFDNVANKNIGLL